LVGPHKLLEQIGEGGFGVVFMAEQQEPIRRKVAVKVLKPGMDSKQVIARFEAERQALALMDHPNIARALDAGQTASGRPYFVMDLVKGLPITEFCDQAQFTPRERLELFVSVCAAVQHAHHKGIIHRDLKPTNVLVTLQDGAPLVKVIDFGIAKALGQQLTDKTLHTGFAQMIGTPLYMSPEQAALSNVDVDTRSDVYSLGVLLYELLTGTTPFTKEQLSRVGYDEMRRIIREVEPPRPSTRLSTMGQAATTISTQRKSDPKRLSQLFRGELDWIVMKALDKDRNRRYETASAFARDVQRYLANEPVEACPPSAAYRLRKMLYRHRRVVIPAAAFVVLLATAAVTSTWLAVWAVGAEKDAREAGKKVGETLEKVTKQKDRAEKAEKETAAEAATLRAAFQFFQEDLLGLSESGDQDVLREPNIPLRTVLDRAASNVGKRFKGRPIEEARIRFTIGNAYRILLDNRKAEEHLKKAVELQRVLLGPENPETLTSMHFLARVYLQQGLVGQGEPLAAKVLEARRRVLGEKHRDTLRSFNNLVVARSRGGAKREDVLKLLLQGLEASRQGLGPEDRLTLQFQYNAASIYRDLGQWDKAEPLYKKTLAAQRRVLGRDDPATCMTALQLGILSVKKSQPLKAAPLLDEALEGFTRLIKTGGAQSGNIQALMAAGLVRATIDAFASQACDLLSRKQYAEAVPLLRQYLDIWKKHDEVLKTVQPHVWQPHHVRLLLGRCLAGQKNYKEAEPYLLAGLEETRRQADKGKAQVPNSPFSRDFELGAVCEQVTRFYQGRKMPEKAAALLKKPRPPK
jgi:tetratricopeptide (TPR) repeat protein